MFGWRASPAPGIPRSVVGPLGFARSRPFRCAKGAWVVLVQRVGGEGVCWWFGWQGRFETCLYGAIAQRPERVRDTWICAAFPLPCPSGWRFRPLRRRLVPE